MLKDCFALSRLWMPLLTDEKENHKWTRKLGKERNDGKREWKIEYNARKKERLIIRREKEMKNGLIERKKERASEWENWIIEEGKR